MRCSSILPPRVRDRLSCFEVLMLSELLESGAGLDLRFDTGLLRKRVVDFAFWRMACFTHGHLPSGR